MFLKASTVLEPLSGGDDVLVSEDNVVEYVEGLC